jgi:hypothetical protein
MIAPQAKRKPPEGIALVGLRQGLEKRHEVVMAGENRGPIVASIERVINETARSQRAGNIFFQILQAFLVIRALFPTAASKGQRC